ncbi:MAG: hypothetical protein V4582_15445 [Pseudomonadota bacterium]
MSQKSDLDRKLQEQLLLAPRVDGDRLMLADAVLAAALDGSRPLGAGERAALSASPLTLRRLRQLVIERRGGAIAARWAGSAGMLRAAAGGAALDTLTTDDGFWTLHFLPDGEAWIVILKLDAGAPFAAALLRDRAPLHVLDGVGATVMQGALDADGECERAWPFALAPGPHFQHFAAGFAVRPLAP